MIHAFTASSQVAENRCVADISCQKKRSKSLLPWSWVVDFRVYQIRPSFPFVLVISDDIKSNSNTKSGDYSHSIVLGGFEEIS